MPSSPFVHSVSSIVQGISRQAPGVRYPGQVESAKNISFNVIDGARKRPSTIHASEVEDISSTAEFNKYAMHRIERDDEEEYLIVHGTSFFKVFDVVNNIWVTPTFTADAEQYIKSQGPDHKSLKFVTIADTTIIVNTKVITGTSEDGSSIDAAGMPIKMSRTSVSPLAFECARCEWKERSWHQQVIKSTATSGTFRLGYLGESASYSKEKNDATLIHMPFNVEADDLSEYINGNGVKLEDAAKKHEYISGLATVSYGKAIVTGGPLHKKDIKILFSKDLDVDSLVTIVDQNTNGMIEVKRGDNEVDPPPMIFDEKMAISNITYYRNRLVFTADEVVVFSATDDIFNMYQETPGTLVDSDPIVAQLASTDVCIIDAMVPFRNALILLTKAGQQFELGTGGDVLSPSTASVTPSTRYQTQSVQPCQINDRLYMVGKSGTYTPVLEYFYDDNAVSNKAANITKHVDNLIPPVVFHIEASPSQECVFVMPTLDGDTTESVVLSVLDGSDDTSGADLWSETATWFGGIAPKQIDSATIVNGHTVTFDDYPAGASSLLLATENNIAAKIFVYRSYSVGNERKQSAWTVWDFSTDAMMDMKVIDDTLYVVSRHTHASDGKNYARIETMDLSEDRTALVGLSGSKWNPALDHRQGPLVGSHSDGTTTWALPTPDLTANCATKVEDGAVVAVSPSEDGTTVTASGNYAIGTFYVGRKVEAEIVLSTIFARDNQGKPALEGRTNIRKLVLNHTHSGEYSVVIENSNEECPSRTENFTPPVAKTIEDLGEFTTWVHGTNVETTITLKSDGPKPVTWVALEAHGVIDKMLGGKK
jgi:hypothetical protein